MVWLESHDTLLKHPKLLNLADLLNTDRFKLIGHLHALWWWALANVGPDGALGNRSARQIAIAAEWRGPHERFVAALVACGGDTHEYGFLEQRADGAYAIHDWEHYAGKLLQRRATARSRKQSSRLNGHAPSAGPTADGPHPVRTPSAGPTADGPHLVRTPSAGPDCAPGPHPVRRTHSVRRTDSGRSAPGPHSVRRHRLRTVRTRSALRPQDRLRTVRTWSALRPQDRLRTVRTWSALRPQDRLRTVRTRSARCPQPPARATP